MCKGLSFRGFHDLCLQTTVDRGCKPSSMFACKLEPERSESRDGPSVFDCNSTPVPHRGASVMQPYWPSPRATPTVHHCPGTRAGVLIMTSTGPIADRTACALVRRVGAGLRTPHPVTLVFGDREVVPPVQEVGVPVAVEPTIYLRAGAPWALMPTKRLWAVSGVGWNGRPMKFQPDSSDTGTGATRAALPPPANNRCRRSSP